MSSYSRANPSPRYLQLMALYARMHLEGETRLGIAPQATFPGKSLLPHVGHVKALVEATQARTILDYGSGKGLQYRARRVVVDGGQVADSIAEYWDVDEVVCYDPGYEPYRQLPVGKFDGVVSTDVLEHCPEEDLSWISAEIFAFAHRFVFLNVACYPARKRLPDGVNAHLTVREPDWWRDLISERAAAQPGVLWELRASTIIDGRLAERVYRSRRPEKPAG